MIGARLGYLFIFFEKSEKDFPKGIDKCRFLEYNIIRLAEANCKKHSARAEKSFWRAP